MNLLHHAAIGMVVIVAAQVASGAQLASVSIVKAVAYEQSSSNAPVLAGYAVEADASFDSLITGATVRLQKPNGTIDLLPEDDGTSYSMQAEFGSLAAMNSSFPTGTYVFRFGGSASGNYTLPLPAMSLPGATSVVDFDAAQNIANPSEFTLRWTAIAGATADDLFLLLIQATDDSFSYESSALAGTTTQLSVPLPANKHFEGAIAFVHIAQQSTLPNQVVGLVGTMAITGFPLRTLALQIPPRFTTHPANASVLAGGGTTFHAMADGTPAPILQWQRKPAASSDWSNLVDGAGVSGTSSIGLQLSGVPRSWAGDEFRCVATGAPPNAISNPARLAVLPAYTVSVVAGRPGEGGFNDGAAGAARFSYPQGLAVSADGTIYVASGATLRKISPTGEVFTVVGAGQSPVPPLSNASDVVVAPDGTLYACDTMRHTIVKITPDGTVTLFAGLAGASGSADGIGDAARFWEPGAIAVDRLGHVYVSDGGNRTVRKISPEGVVTTLAGSPGQIGAVDGVGPAARFMDVRGLTVDRLGNVYVVDAHSLRKISAEGVVSRVALVGLAGGLFAHDVAVDDAGYLYINTSPGLVRITPNGIMRAVAGNDSPTGEIAGLGGAVAGYGFNALAVGPDGAVYCSDGGRHIIRKAVPWANLTFSSIPQSAAIVTDESVTLTATASTDGASIAYQWRFNGVDIPGANQSTLTLPSAQLFSGGEYTVVAAADGVSILSAPATLTVTPLATSPMARLTNLSTRAVALTGDNVLIPGFVVAGPGNKQLLIRAVGPTLGTLGVSGTLPDPRLTLKRWNGTAYEDIATNDNWGTNPNAAAIITKSADLFAFPLATGSADAALLVDLAPGQYSAVAGDAGTQTGIAIVELYDADTNGGTARLINISNRGFVGTGDSIMIPGFVVSDEGPKTLLIRAVGPTLASFGVSGVLADPTLVIYRRVQGTEELILTNDDWSTGPGAARTRDVAAQIQAFALPEGSKDAAFVVTLNPGIYTVHARGANGTTGVALVEVYAVP